MGIMLTLFRLLIIANHCQHGLESELPNAAVIIRTNGAGIINALVTCSDTSLRFVTATLFEVECTCDMHFGAIAEDIGDCYDLSESGS